MITLGGITIVCVFFLIFQYRQHLHEGLRLEPRIEALEKRQSDAFDPKAFAELQTKVESLRIGQGIRGTR